MKKVTPYSAIVYGNVINDKNCRHIKKKKNSICFKQDNSLFEISENQTTVFVDLDDPNYVDPSFLISIATAGENIKLIGKADNLNIDETINVSKFGISEVLNQEQCLQRLHQFLDEIENESKQNNSKNNRYGFDALIGISPQTEKIRATLELLSDVDFPSALILGDTGTGKSLISKILHHSGTRSNHNLVEVNCSAIPDELFESELFGHAKGAFTGAKTEKIGLFEYSQNGTLFLDEVGNLSMSAQAKLLKILEDKKLRKVGDINEQDINVRVVTATNTNLAQAIQDGKFREDLYYRLNLLTIEIPPLQERISDVPELINYYLKYFSTLYNKSNINFSDKGITELKNYSWPGNVRELSNVIERVVLLTKKNTIRYSDIHDSLKKGRMNAEGVNQFVIDIPQHGISLEEVEHKVVADVLKMYDWNKSETASFLHISRPRLRRIIEKAGLVQNRQK